MISYYCYPGITRPAQGAILTGKDRIIRKICGHFNVPVVDVMGKDRRREFTEPRHISWYFLIKNGMYQRQVGDLFNRDHTSIHHGVQVIIDRMSVDTSFAAIVTEIESLL